MAKIALIGGTGLTTLPNLEITHKKVIYTPYGEPSAPLTFGHYQQHEIVFLPRHGYQHQYPPHLVNYRANIWALKEIGIEYIIAVTAVGGISPEMTPARLSIPDQIIDYTYERANTFFTGYPHTEVKHIDFTYPYCQKLREYLLQAAEQANLDIVKKATYAAMQGPRLETAAEIQKLKQEGCDIVGMTAMPEACLARELELCYAGCSIVANWGAGILQQEITMNEIHANLDKGKENLNTLLSHALALI